MFQGGNIRAFFLVYLFFSYSEIFYLFFVKLDILLSFMCLAQAFLVDCQTCFHCDMKILWLC